MSDREERKRAAAGAEREMRKGVARALAIPTRKGTAGKSRVTGRTHRHYLTKAAEFKSVGERTVRVIATDGTLDACGDIVQPGGGDFVQYRKNPVVLWAHDPEKPVATCTLVTEVGSRVEATIVFPPAGTSPLSDETYRLVKSGVVNAVSIGFDATNAEPLDPQNPRGGTRYIKWKLYEISFVSVPANPSALVIQRSSRLAPSRKASSAKVQPKPQSKTLMGAVSDQLPDKGFGGLLRGIAGMHRR